MGCYGLGHVNWMWVNHISLDQRCWPSEKYVSTVRKEKKGNFCMEKLILQKEHLGDKSLMRLKIKHRAFLFAIGVSL